MLFVNNSDTRGTSGGRGERGLLKKAWRKLYNRESFTGALTKAVTNKKFRPPLQEQNVNVSVSAKHRPKLHIESRSDSMTPKNRRFFWSFGTTPRVVHVKFCGLVQQDYRP